MALKIQDKSGPGLPIARLKSTAYWPKLRDRIREYLDCVWLYDSLKSYIIGLGKVPMSEDEQSDLKLLSREIVKVHQGQHKADVLKDTVND